MFTECKHMIFIITVVNIQTNIQTQMCLAYPYSFLIFATSRFPLFASSPRPLPSVLMALLSVCILHLHPVALTSPSSFATHRGSWAGSVACQVWQAVARMMHHLRSLWTSFYFLPVSHPLFLGIRISFEHSERKWQPQVGALGP